MGSLPLTRIAGTNVFGFVRDSYTQQPLVGATIRVDAFPEANAVTDEMLAVITAGGLTPDEATFTQLRDAILRI